MNTSKFGAFLFLSLFCYAKLWAYPQILNWQNEPVIAFENKKQAELKINGLLKAPFAAVMGPRDQLSIRLNSFDRVDLFENTKVQTLDLLVEAEFVPDFYLLDGRIRLRTEFRGLEKKDLNMNLRTPFFDLKLATEVDFYVILNMKKPSVEIKLIKGELPLEFFAYEKKITLKEGQSVVFEGELADDKKSIRYDFLLNNRKVPKGQLLEAESFDREEYLNADEKARQAEIKRKKEIEKKRLDKVRKKKEYEASFICKKPFGHKDQCAWRAEKGKCFRSRCNVSGEWGELMERPMDSRCKANFHVAACDY